MIFESTYITTLAASPDVPSHFYVAVGGQKTIPCDLSGCKGKKRNWSTKSNNGVFKISSSGVVTGKRRGSGTAVCSTQYDETASTLVHVVPAAKVVFSSSSASLKCGETYTIRYSIEPYDAIKSVHWSSSNSSIASVSNGTVTAHSTTGSCKIYCTTEDGLNKSYSFNVKVHKASTTKKETTSKHKKHKTTTTKKHKQSTTRKKRTTTNKNKTTTRRNKTTTTKRSYFYEDVNDNYDSYDTTSYNDNNDDDIFSNYEENTETSEEDDDVRIVNRISETTTEDLNELVDEMDDSNNSYQEDSEYKLKAISKKRNPIVIKWDKIKDVDGYELYCSDNTKVVRFVPIYCGKNNHYEKHCYDRGGNYFFMVRAYKYVNNKKQYSNYSEIIYIKAVRRSVFSYLL